MDQIELEKYVDSLSEEDKQAILNTEFPEEIEKQAAAAFAEADLIDNLYAYGAMTADMELEDAEAGEAGLSKEASADFEQAEKEISEAIETGVAATGLSELEDEVELHKKAQAMSAVIFQGYTDYIEKMAGKKEHAGKVGKWLASKAKKAGKMMGAAKDSAKKHGGKVADHMKKHKKAYMVGAGSAALAAGGGAMAHKHMSKKASELTVDELTGAMLNRMDAVEVVEEGLEKLSSAAGKIGDKVKKHLGTARAHLGAHKEKYSAGAGAAAGGMAAHLAHRMGKKDK